MKYVALILCLLFIASCSSEEDMDSTETLSQTQADTQLESSLSNDINDVTESLPSEIINSNVAESEIIQTSTTYTNPATQAIMNIEYSLAEDGTFDYIEVTSPNYSGMTKFNEGIQGLIGLPASEATEFYVTGSSLASPAFQDAMKESLNI